MGYTDAYQGDRELQVISLEILDDAPYIYQPRVLTTAQATDYGTYGGRFGNGRNGDTLPDHTQDVLIDGSVGIGQIPDIVQRLYRQSRQRHLAGQGL